MHIYTCIMPSPAVVPECESYPGPYSYALLTSVHTGGHYVHSTLVETLHSPLLPKNYVLTSSQAQLSH